MRRRLLVALSGILLSVTSFAQPSVMQASLSTGTTSTRVKIFIRPTVGITAGNISTFQFNLAIPASVTPAPTMSFVAPPVFGSGWVLPASHVEGGFRHYEIVSATGGPMTLAANTELEVMEVEFTGGPVGFSSTGVALYTLPGGGVNTGNSLFLCTGASNSEEGQLYYAKPGVTVVNEASYTGALPSSATISGTLPVSFSSYDARCHEKGAMISWTTSSEQNSKYFDIERSEDGSTWRKIGSVEAAGNSSNTRTYSYLDLEGGTALYRILQVDLDGRSVLTGVKRTDCKTSDFSVALYPIPTKDRLTVVIRSDKDIRTDIQVIDMKGSILRRLPTQINKGNNTINLMVTDLPAGQYMLRSADAGMIINKKFTVAR